MDVIYTNAHRDDVGVLSAYSLDMAIGDENNFELTVPQDCNIENGSLVYVTGTQFGGMVGKIVSDTGDSDVKWLGPTWHGMMAARFVRPHAGEDWREITGEANACLLEIADEIDLDDVFTVSAEDSGIRVDGYRFERYVDAYTGITDMLRDSGARLDMAMDGGRVVLSAHPIKDWSQEELDSEHMRLKVEKSYRPVNHLICLGKGELRDRIVIDLYADEAGNVSQTQTIFGAAVEERRYENSSSEYDELLESGTKKLKELQNPVSCEATLDDGCAYEIGDVVGGRDSITGIAVASEVSKMILRIDNKHPDGSVEYGIGEISRMDTGSGASGGGSGAYSLPTATDIVKGGVYLTDAIGLQGSRDGLAATPKAVRTGSTAQMTVEEDVSGTGVDRVRVLNADGEVLGGAPLPYERIPNAAIASLFE